MKIQFVGADWKDTSGLAEAFKKAINKSVGKQWVYDDPTCEGSDWFGYILSDTKLNEKQLRDAAAKELGYADWKAYEKEMKGEDDAPKPKGWHTYRGECLDDGMSEDEANRAADKEFGVA
jgi:hypothetical protein